MSFYVKRIQHGDGPNRPDGSIGWIGPIRSRAQAIREVQAWQRSTGSYGQTWSALLCESTAEIRAEVRAWSRSIKSIQA